MTELDRAELTEIIEGAIERQAAPLMRRYAQELIEAINLDSAVMAEREACALIAERMGADAVAAAIRGQE